MQISRSLGVLMCAFLGYVLLVCPEIARSQSLAPGRISRAATDKSCDDILSGLSWWLPLKDEDDSTNSTAIDCFYQTNGVTAPLNQVRFLYGIGGGDSKTLAADLVSIQFPYGLQASLGSSVTMGTSTTNTVTTITNSKQSTTQQTADTPATAIDKLEASGGDLYVRFEYPMLYKNSTKRNLTGMLFSVSRLGANFSGFGSEATITEANEYNVNSSFEGYGEWRAFHNAGLLYTDARSGFQYVQPAFARAIGLGGRHNFALTQIAAGIEFSQLLRIGFQRFIGPSAAFGVSNAEISKWHLVLEIVPKRKTIEASQAKRQRIKGDAKQDTSGSLQTLP